MNKEIELIRETFYTQNSNIREFHELTLFLKRYEEKYIYQTSIVGKEMKNEK